MLLWVLFAWLPFLSCGKHQEISLVSNYENKVWNDTVASYQEDFDFEKKIQWLNDAAKLFSSQKGRDILIQPLLSIALSTEDDAFRSYVYFFISDIYWKWNNTRLSVFYMTKVRETHYSLRYDENPIGYMIGLRIIKLEDYPYLRIRMYHVLLTQYSDLIDEFLLLYELSELYKQQYDIYAAIDVMKRMVNLAARNRITDDRVDINQIKSEINFFYSEKKWIYKDLNKLINNIKYAIDTRNKARLYSYLPLDGFSVRFFASNDFRWGIRELSIPNRWGRNIRFSSKFEEISNEDEVFLETTGWVFPQLSTWYFYFKRVNYPYDNNINGGWEWKGIYFGSWM